MSSPRKDSNFKAKTKEACKKATHLHIFHSIFKGNVNTDRIIKTQSNFGMPDVCSQLFKLTWCFISA